ncbi:uncharacterized protein LOC128987933 isoform X2 [Macrosteles quadrilineatus]|uniref:uncharacterized protein LOC128987933 isoform X2 n=1 Tax=Macrosteles quadrilineatus TaxID=74068 RepID=UPI0023E25C1F|nr:uncharacterized protein LOC128987933 isoform X2 [Macrosteles quadrilineatus]
MAFYKQLSQKHLKFRLPKFPPDDPTPKTESAWEKKIQVVSRAEWGALPPRTDVDHPKPVPWPHPWVLWTYAQTDECFTQEECGRVMRKTQQRHMDMGMSDIQYKR